MRFIVAVAAVLGAASASDIIGNLHTDAKCASKRNAPVKLNKCSTVSARGSVTLFEAAKCTAYRATGCRGAAKAIDGAEGCHAAKNWGQPKSFKCVALPAETDEAE